MSQIKDINKDEPVMKSGTPQQQAQGIIAQAQAQAKKIIQHANMQAKQIRAAAQDEYGEGETIIETTVGQMWIYNEAGESKVIQGTEVPEGWFDSPQ